MLEDAIKELTAEINALRQGLSALKTAEVTKVETKKPAKKKKVKEVVEDSQTSDVTLDDLRFVSKKLIVAGLRDDAVETINSFGAEKLNELKETQYKEVLDELNILLEKADG